MGRISSWSQWVVSGVFLLILASCTFLEGQPFKAESNISIPGSGSTPSPAWPQPGQVVTLTGPPGPHHLYLPTTLATAPEVVVLVHGTPGKAETAVEVARYYLQNWVNVAEEHGVILLAPAFDDANYSSKDGSQAMGGYRGLFGRTLGADQFVLKLVDHYQRQAGSAGKKFYLYGHSAGGQFVARFIVKHPERVKGAVITAAATYPQPRPDIPWPYGLGRLQTTLHWPNPATETEVNITPDPADWLAATTVPVTVIVGLNDLEWQPGRTGQQGHNRVAIARHWVQAMNRFAAEHGVESNLKLSLIPNLGHSSGGLLPYSQAALLP